MRCHWEFQGRRAEDDTIGDVESCIWYWRLLSMDHWNMILYWSLAWSLYWYQSLSGLAMMPSNVMVLKDLKLSGSHLRHGDSEHRGSQSSAQKPGASRHFTSTRAPRHAFMIYN